METERSLLLVGLCSVSAITQEQITHGSRRLSSDRVQGILQLPSPMTRKQLRAFLGLTGYCRIWIPNYGLIAQPLYESLKG